MNPSAPDPARLRLRAGSLRATAAALEHLAGRAALAAAGPDTWTGPTAASVHDDLRLAVSALDRAVGELRRLAAHLEHQAGARS